MRALLLLCFVSSVALAEAVVTKDGVIHTGRILDKTEKGYLFRSDSGETTVIDFNEVDDVRRGDDWRRPSDAPVVRPVPSLIPDPDVAKLLVRIHNLRLDREDIGLAGPTVFLSIGAALLLSALVIYTVPRNEGAWVYPVVIGFPLSVVSGIVLGNRVSNRARISRDIAGLEIKAAELGVPVPAE